MVPPEIVWQLWDNSDFANWVIKWTLNSEATAKIIILDGI